MTTAGRLTAGLVLMDQPRQLDSSESGRLQWIDPTKTALAARDCYAT
jgi:hypothetical protein